MISLTEKNWIARAMKNVDEKYEGFKKVEAEARSSGARNPAAVAAAAGMKKYGKKKFEAAAHAGRKLGKEEVETDGRTIDETKSASKVAHRKAEAASIESKPAGERKKIDWKRLGKLKASLHARGEETEIDEKWSNDYETPKSRRGMFKGRSLSSLEKQASHATGTKEKQVEFAIRAKTGWGKVHKEEMGTLGPETTVKGGPDFSEEEIPGPGKEPTGKKPIAGKFEEVPKKHNPGFGDDTPEKVKAYLTSKGVTEEMVEEVATAILDKKPELSAEEAVELAIGFFLDENTILSEIVQSAVDDKVDEFTNAFSDAIQAVIQKKIAEKKLDLQKKLLGVEEEFVPDEEDETEDELVGQFVDFLDNVDDDASIEEAVELFAKEAKLDDEAKGKLEECLSRYLQS